MKTKLRIKNFLAGLFCAGFLMLTASACSLLSPDDEPVYQTNSESDTAERG